MIYLLDTNVCIRYLNSRSTAIRRKLLSTPEAEIVLCSVVKAELLFGAAKGDNKAKRLAQLDLFFARFVSLPFDDRAAKVYGRIRAELEKQGRPIGPNDLLIAAIAMANDLTLVTHNVREFGRVTNLQLEDWENGSV